MSMSLFWWILRFGSLLVSLQPSPLSVYGLVYAHRHPPFLDLLLVLFVQHLYNIVFPTASLKTFCSIKLFWQETSFFICDISWRVYSVQQVKYWPSVTLVKFNCITMWSCFFLEHWLHKACTNLNMNLNIFSHSPNTFKSSDGINLYSVGNLLGTRD